MSYIIDPNMIGDFTESFLEISYRVTYRFFSMIPGWLKWTVLIGMFVLSAFVLIAIIKMRDSWRHRLY